MLQILQPAEHQQDVCSLCMHVDVLNHSCWQHVVAVVFVDKSSYGQAILSKPRTVVLLL